MVFGTLVGFRKRKTDGEPGFRRQDKKGVSFLFALGSSSN